MLVQQGLEALAIGRLAGHRDDQAVMAGTETPQVQIEHFAVQFAFDQAADVFGHGWIVDRIEQDQGAVAGQADGPARDHDGAEKAELRELLAARVPVAKPA